MNVEQREVPGCLQRAAGLIDAHVNRLAAAAGDRPLHAADR